MPISLWRHNTRRCERAHLRTDLIKKKKKHTQLTHTHTYAYTDGLYYKEHTSTHAEGTDLGGAGRASKDQEALWPPVLKARRRRNIHMNHISARSTATDADLAVNTKDEVCKWARLKTTDHIKKMKTGETRTHTH